MRILPFINSVCLIKTKRYNNEKKKYTETDPSSFKSLSVEMFYEVLEYFDLDEIIHSLTNISFHLN